MNKFPLLLEQIGLSPREAQVYLAVVHDKEANIAAIMHATRIPRMSIYPILEDLMKKGFVESIVKRKRRYFLACSPKKILSTVMAHLKEFEEAIPVLELQGNHNEAVPRLLYFEGREAIKKVFEMILEEKRPFAAITSIDDMDLIARDYFGQFIGKRVERSLPVRLLTNRTAAAASLKEGDSREFRQTRFVPESYRFQTANYITGNIVALLSLNQKTPAALIIHDEAIARTFAMYFEIMWEIAGSEGKRGGFGSPEAAIQVIKEKCGCDCCQKKN